MSSAERVQRHRERAAAEQGKRFEVRASEPDVSTLRELARRMATGQVKRADVQRLIDAADAEVRGPWSGNWREALVQLRVRGILPVDDGTELYVRSREPDRPAEFD